MLADRRRVGALWQPLAVELERRRGNVVGFIADARLHQPAERVQVRIVEQIPGLRDRRERQPDLLELRREACLVELLYQRGEGGQEPAALLHALAVGLQA